ncbi:MAG: tetratricopeptide repeat protein, partial [Planctomycetales bacterium]|nr:tetratricopeptide repeat protein [Planctomycetales bacterium]
MPVAIELRLGLLRRRCFPAILLAASLLQISVPTRAISQENAGSQDTGQGNQPAAEQAAGDAEESSPEALAAYAKAATFQNNGAFDLAAEGWQGFLKDYAADPKAVEATYNLGVCYLELNDFQKAREQLKAAIDTGKGFPRREDAFLNLGWASYTLALQNKPELLADSAAAFDALIQAFPDGQYRDKAMFLRGESLYLQGKRPEAITSYKELLEEFPTPESSDQRPHGLYALGVAYEETGQWNDAKDVYERYLEQYADEPLAAEVQMRRAETVLQGGDAAAAEKLFADVAALPDFKQADHARYRQAFCLARQEKFAEAADQFASIARDFPESRYATDADISAARSYFRAEKFAEAKAAFTKLLEIEGPYATEAAHWLARLQHKEGDLPGAVRIVEAQLPKAEAGQHPFFPNLQLDLADFLYEQPDKRTEAIDLYLKFASDFPLHILAPQALYNAAFGALELKDFKRGVELTNEFISKFPEHRLLADVKHVAAECQLQLGDSEGAAETFSELASQTESPVESSQLQLRQAVALFAQKKYRETLAQIEANLPTLKTPDALAEAYYLAGMSYYSLQEFEDAKQALQKSYEAQPTWRQADDALLSLSRTQRKLRDVQGARETVNRMLREFPESKLIDQAYFRLAEYSYALSDFAGAAEHYRHVIKDWPKSALIPYALYGLGWSELKSNRLPAAEAAFRQLLKDAPEHSLIPQTQYALAMTLQQAGKFDDAVTQLTSYEKRELNPRERADALYVRGLCLVGKKDHAGAIETFKQIVATEPEYVNGEKVLYELAWAHKSLKQDAEAIAAFEELAKRYPQGTLLAESSYHLGEQAYDAGKYEEAVKWYSQARSRVGDNADLAEKVRYKLGWASYQLQDYDAADKVFQEQVEQRPDGTLAGDAYFMQGECRFKATKYKEALEAYRAAQSHKVSSDQIATLN